MTGGEAAQLITSIATLIGVGVSAFISLRNSRKIETTAAGVQEIKKATDGMKNELVELTAKSSKAEGVLQGRAEVHEENSAR